MGTSVKQYFKPLYNSMPSPIKRSYRHLHGVYKKIFNSKPTFSGWGMQTYHSLPWQDSNEAEAFCQAAKDIKKGFEFYKGTGVTKDNVDELLWRHWVISYGVRHALEFTKVADTHCVECGVCDGMSAFFELYELRDLKEKQKIKDYKLHLYDAWQAMRADELKSSEEFLRNKYEGISLEQVEKNLSVFKDNIRCYPGFIPESFEKLENPAKEIVFLHIDLNASVPTHAALEYYYPRLLKGGVIVLDDYGQTAYHEVKSVVDEFFADKPGMLFHLPTSQAIYYR